MGLISSCCRSENEEHNERSLQHLQNQGPQNERTSRLSELRPRDFVQKRAPLHMALYSHYNLAMYNTELNVTELQEGTPKYEQLKCQFMNTTQRHYRVIKIDHINNMFLQLFYLLKREEYRHMYGRENVTEKILFHGSKLDNILNICLDNFNWRLHSRQALFGKGVNFSYISNYASNYCDTTEKKFMVAAKVLVCRSCTGTRNMVLPPYYDERDKIRYDTSQKEDGHVTVKFNDDECYPEYIIFFSGEKKEDKVQE